MSVQPAVAVLEHYLVGYRRVWRGSVFSTFLLPVLFTVGLGVSVGGFVDRTGTLGLPYLDFITPGLVASTVFQVAIAESTWPIYSALTWTRIFEGVRATPVRVRDIVAGTLAYIQFRSVLAASAFLLVMLVFGAVHSAWALAVPPVAALLGAAVAAPVAAYTASVRTDSALAMLFRFVMIPLTLFSGVFFPVDQLPAAVLPIVWVSPLWHGVELCRSATLGTGSAAGALGHVAVLGLWLGVGFRLARHRFAVRLGG